MTNKCRWKLEYENAYEIECDGAIFPNMKESVCLNFKFCPYCGHPIEFTEEKE